MNPAGRLPRPLPRPRAQTIATALLLAVTRALTAGPAADAAPEPPPASPPPTTALSNSPPPRVRWEGDRVWMGGAQVDPGARTVTVPARLNMTNGVLEYVLVAEYGKTHESLLLTDIAAQDLQSALLLLHARPAGPGALERPLATWPLPSALALTLAWNHNGHRVVRPLHEVIGLTDGPNGPVTNSLPAGLWLFNGSTFTREGFAAHFDGSYVSLITDPAAIVNNPRPDREDDDIHTPRPDRLPALKTPVSLIFEVQAPRETPGSTTAP